MEVNNIKVGARVKFDIVSKDKVIGVGYGVVTRKSLSGHPLVNPDVPLPIGTAISNLTEVDSK